MNREKQQKQAPARFLIYSLLGIFVFFVQITINGKNSIPVDHMIALLKRAVSGYYGWIIFVISGYFVFTRIMKNGVGKKLSDRLFFLQSVLGFLISGAVLGKIGPEAFLKAGASAIDATGNILCAIFLSSVFIPLLVEYGLVDASGVIFRPLMRKLFLTPGSSAVIGISAFLGNYSTGHVVSRQMYEEGKFTEKEAVIVALGFSTCSIGLMLNLVNYLDLMEYWSVYVICILVITFTTTALVSRIFPISGKKEEYIEGVRPVREENTLPGQILKDAWKVGTERAGSAPKAAKAVRNILRRVFPIICEITGTSMFVIVCGILAAQYTDAFLYLGSFLSPVLRLAGVVAADIPYVVRGIGACIMEPVLAGIICGGKGLSLEARWITAVVPYSAIVFFAGFIPSVRSSRIPCRIWEMAAVWVERVFISTLLAVVTAKVLF